MAENKLGMEKSVLYSIGKGIYDGIGKELQNKKAELKLYTTNCLPSLKWDLINKNIKKYLENMGFTVQCVKKKRGIWGFLLVADKKDNRLCTIMREERLFELIKKPWKHKYHYASALSNFFNYKLKPKNEQKKLIVMPKSKDEIFKLNKISIDICSDIQINQDTTLYVIITYTARNYILTSLKAYILTKDLQISDTIDLSEYMPKDFEAVITEDDTPTKQGDITLKFRQPAIDKINKHKKEKEIELNLKTDKEKEENQKDNNNDK